MVFGCTAQYKCFGDGRRVFSCSCSNAATETNVAFVIRYQNASMPLQNGSSPCRERWRPRGFVKFRRFRQRPTQSSVTFGIKVGVRCNSGAQLSRIGGRNGPIHERAVQLCTHPRAVIEVLEPFTSCAGLFQWALVHNGASGSCSS